MKRREAEISFVWVPAHVRIASNEKVDELAKEVAEKETIDVNINLSKVEGKSIVWQETILKWQQLWEQENKGRHLFSISSRVNDLVNICKRGWIRRKEQVIISRIRIGHTFLNNTLFILGEHQSGLCSCQKLKTVQHVLMSCRKYDCQRQELLRELQEIGLEEVSLKSILAVGSSRRGIHCFFFFQILTRHWSV